LQEGAGGQGGELGEAAAREHLCLC
jgi:hypothetical protein